MVLKLVDHWPHILGWVVSLRHVYPGAVLWIVVVYEALAFATVSWAVVVHRTLRLSIFKDQLLLVLLIGFGIEELIDHLHFGILFQMVGLHRFSHGYFFGQLLRNCSLRFHFERCSGLAIQSWLFNWQFLVFLGGFVMQGLILLV